MMAIPDYQSVMLPFLKRLSDNKEHSTRELIESLAKTFGLSDAERKELLSGGQPVFGNRVGWARAYLKKAGLIASPKWGYQKITARGAQVLSEKPAKIDVKLLEQFPEFAEFMSTKKGLNSTATSLKDNNAQTPSDAIELAYQQIKKELSEELIAKVMTLSPTSFENLVVELLVRMGYGGSFNDAAQAIGGTGDEGIDGTIKEDKLGLDTIYVQAKRWKPGHVVGRPELQKFVGALAGKGARKGIFITTSSFSKEANDYAPKNETKIVLIDGAALTRYMIDHDLGVTPVSRYEIKRIDHDYFGEE
jgi:restriction system protein